MRRAFLARAALIEPEALAVHLENVRMVGEAVEQRSGESFGAEGFGPFIEGRVRGDEDRGALVASLRRTHHHCISPSNGHGRSPGAPTAAKMYTHRA